MILLLILSLRHIVGVNSIDSYAFAVEWDKTDWPGIEAPKCGKEIPLMEVLKHPEPNQIRLAYTGNPTEMSIMWTTNNVDHINEVKYGLLQSDLNYTAWAFSDQHSWYNDYQSGHIHRALMENLEPGRIHYYQITSNDETTDTVEFLAAPAPGSEAPVSILHIGDVGIFGTSVMVTKNMMLNSADKTFHGIIHCGDIAYADKYDGVKPEWARQDMWDTWGAMVEPLSNHIPYMVTPGNHEIDFPDSAGENMTTYMRRFTMPGNMRYYSFPVGMVHFVAVSSDESIDSESTQGRWLERKLQYLNENRDKWPWVVTFQHRPIYNSNENHGNWTGVNRWDEPDWVYPEKLGWPDDYEAMLLKYNVDLVLNGHVHHYERTWPIKNRNDVTYSYENTQAPVHITCGHGGKDLYKWVWDTDSTVNTYNDTTPHFVASRSNVHWGHCEMHFLDRNTVVHKMYKMGERTPSDDITITRDHPLSAAGGFAAAAQLLVLSQFVIFFNT